jgi:hypothetical protein
MSDDSKNMFMNDQAVGAVMMALQKSLMEQTDIVPVLKSFKFRLSEAGLVVLNPPLVKAEYAETEEAEEDA